MLTCWNQSCSILSLTWCSVDMQQWHKSQRLSTRFCLQQHTVLAEEWCASSWLRNPQSKVKMWKKNRLFNLRSTSPTHIVHKQHLCSGCFFLKTLPGALYSRRSGQVPVPGARASLPTQSAPTTNNNPLTMKLWVILHNPICWGYPNISPTWGCWITWVCRIMLIPGRFNLSGVAGQSS